MGFEVGKTVAGYEIVEVLGSSKTGAAYKVRNVFAQRFEVLKILSKNVHGDEEQIGRFLREIKVHARLVHPNIVAFYNAREIDGQLVMTTEYVPGLTVAERLETGPVTWRDAVRCASQALAALEYAHANGIIHRGLSPSNLVIASDGSVRLSGFGMAKAAGDPGLTAAGTVVGPLRYISPEQVKGAGLDARSDIYSMGVVLYEMLTGKLPFESKGQFEIMLAHVSTPPRHPSEVSAEVPRALGDVVMKALAKEPDQRFQGAKEFREALEQLTADEKTATTAMPAGAAIAETAEPMPGKPVAAACDMPKPDTSEALQPVPPPPVAGNSFLSTLGLALAVCLFTFLLGSVALLAVMAMTKR